MRCDVMTPPLTVRPCGGHWGQSNRDSSPGPPTQQNRGRRVAKSFLHTFIEMWLPLNNDPGERQVYTPLLSLSLLSPLGLYLPCVVGGGWVLVGCTSLTRA
jgi:hypothetical protein